MTDRDFRKVAGLHPELIARIGRVLDAMDAYGHPMMVTDGLRTAQEQQALYAKGRTAPGKIVTNADGVTKVSNHQPKADGFGRAVDCCFVVDGKPSWDARLPWQVYGALVQGADLAWGGSWKSFTDLPHAELVAL